MCLLTMVAVGVKTAVLSTIVGVFLLWCLVSVVGAVCDCFSRS